MMTKIKPSYVFLALAILLIFVNPLALIAASYNQETSLVAAGVYTSYRVINRFISMLAETQVQVQGGIVLASASATFAPGKMLQSLLDTLQRLGDLMFPLMIMSGVMAFVIVPVAKLGAAMAAAGLAMRIVLEYAAKLPENVRYATLSISATLLKFGVLLALVIPGTYAAGFAMGEIMTAPSWNRAVSVFSTFTTDITVAEAEVIAEAALEAPDEEIIHAPIEDGVDEETETGFIEGVWGGLTSGAGSVAGATTGALSSVVGSAGNVGGRAWELVAKVPDFVSKAGEIVSVSFEFLIAYLIKTIVLPLLIVSLGIVFWRRMEVAGATPLESRQVKQVFASEAADV